MCGLTSEPSGRWTIISQSSEITSSGFQESPNPPKPSKAAPALQHAPGLRGLSPGLRAILRTQSVSAGARGLVNAGKLMKQSQTEAWKGGKRVTIVSFEACAHGCALSPGDSPLLPDQCIDGRDGNRRLGWTPGLSWKPTLAVSVDGVITASRPDGYEVTVCGLTSEPSRRLTIVSPSAETNALGFHDSSGIHHSLR